MKNRTAIRTTALVTLVSASLPLMGAGDIAMAAPRDVSVIAGTGIAGSTGDGGPAIDAELNRPQDAVLATDGSLIIADSGNDRIRKIDNQGVITTISGIGDNGCSVGETSVDTIYSSPTGLAVDQDGNLYVSSCAVVFKIKPNGTSSIFAGTGSSGGPVGDGGPATGASFSSTRGITVDSSGQVFFAEGNRVRKVDNEGIITTVAGSNSFGFSGDGGPATSATLNYPSDVDVLSDGSILIADTMNLRIRRVDANGIINTVAGNGSYSFASPERTSAVQVGIGQPSAVIGTDDGALVYLASSSVGLVNTSGLYCFIDSSINYGGMSSDDSGNLIIADRESNQIKKLENPQCRPTAKESMQLDPDLDLFLRIVESSSSSGIANGCTQPSPYDSRAIWAPDDQAILSLLADLGLTIEEFLQNQILINAFVNDHIGYNTTPQILESDGATTLYTGNNFYNYFPITQEPSGPPNSRELGTNVYVAESFVRRATDSCTGYVFALDSVLKWPPSGTGTSFTWGYAATPTTSRYNIFKLFFNEPVRGLSSSSFVNTGIQSGCTFTPVPRDRTSEYSSRFDVLAVCPRTGTVAPRLRVSSVQAINGTKQIQDRTGANVVDILTSPVLTVQKTGEGSGTVESTSISGIDCGPMCTGVFQLGQSVTLRATPALGSLFAGWSGPCTGTGLCTVSMATSQTVVANFASAGALLITKIGNGSGSITGGRAGPTCSATTTDPCLFWYQFGVRYTLQATASRGSRFVGWVGDCSGTTTCVADVGPNGVLVYPIFERT